MTDQAPTQVAAVDDPDAKATAEADAAAQAEADAKAKAEAAALAQRAQLALIAMIAMAELELVNGARRFVAGLPETMSLGQEAEAGRVEMMVAAKKIAPLLEQVIAAMKAQIDV